MVIMGYGGSIFKRGLVAPSSSDRMEEIVVEYVNQDRWREAFWAMFSLQTV